MDPDPGAPKHADPDPQHCQHCCLIDPHLNAVCGGRALVAAGEVLAALEAGGQVPLTNGFGSGSPTLLALLPN